MPTETNEEELAELMVGREVELTVDRGESKPADTVLRSMDSVVADDRGSEVVHGVEPRGARRRDLRASPGVAGNGQDELVEAIVGPSSAD